MVAENQLVLYPFCLLLLSSGLKNVSH